MQLTENQKKIVAGILETIDAEVYVFGSRSTGKARVDSDLDLCIKEIVSDRPLETLASLREAFSDSNLPFQVDLVCFDDLSEPFRLVVQQEWIPIKLKSDI